MALARTDVRTLIYTALLLSFGLNLVARGIGETFAVFLLPIEQQMGWSRTVLASVYAIYMGTHGVTGPFIGKLNDRLGPRKVYSFGLILYFVATLLASQATSPWHLYLTSGFLFGLAMTSMSMTTAAVFLSRLYARFNNGDLPPRTPSVSVSFSLVYAGLGAGSMVFPFFAQLLINQFGWRETYIILAIVLFVTLVLVQFIPWEKLSLPLRPKDKQQKQKDKQDLLSALKGQAFWFLFLIYFFTSLAVYLISPQLVAYLVFKGFSQTYAALAFSIIGFLTIFGMAGTGLLADLLGARRTATLSFIMTITGFVLLLSLDGKSAYLALAFAVLTLGLSQGARGPVVSVLASRLFAGANLGLIHGTITMGIGLGGMVGAWSAGHLFERYLSYQPAFYLAIFAAFVGIFLFWAGPFKPTQNKIAKN